MSTKFSTPFLVIIILASIGVGVYFYPALPARIASHWNSSGQVTGFMDKSVGVFLIPLIEALVFIFYLIIPYIDPHKQNFWLFRKEYNAFFILIGLFLFGIELMMLLWNSGVYFNIIEIVLPMTGILFFYIGTLLHYTKPNWFVGIRTPWTLSNPIVWDKTHALGGNLFKISGIFACIGMLVPNYGVLFVLVPAIGVSLFLVMYSYIIYQKIVPS
jgi:immunity protein, SdpI family